MVVGEEQRGCACYTVELTFKDFTNLWYTSGHSSLCSEVEHNARGAKYSCPPRWSSSVLSQSRLSQHFPSWNLGELGCRLMHSRINVGEEGMKALSHWELHGEQGKLSWVSFGFWSEVCSEKAFRGNEKNAKQGCMLLVGQINLWVWSACLNDQTIGVDCSVQLESYYHFKKLTWHISLAAATCWPPYLQRSHLVEIKPALREVTPSKEWSYFSLCTLRATYRCQECCNVAEGEIRRVLISFTCVNPWVSGVLILHSWSRK